MKKLTLLALSLALGCGIAAGAADTTAAVTLPAIDHMVYLSFLPEPEDLMADAKAGGLTVLRLDKTADRVVVSYKYPDGHTATLGYALLSSARNSDRVNTTRTIDADEDRTVVERRTTTVVERDPEVVYVERPYRTRVVYRDYNDDFWLPLTVGLGLGYITGHNSHGHYYYRGGYHGRGWRH
jgi:hypothetical protein